MHLGAVEPPAVAVARRARRRACARRSARPASKIGDRADRRTVGERGSSSSSASDTAPIADDAYGAGHTARPELLEHDRGVDHAHAGAAVLLADEQPDHAELDEAVPHRRGRASASSYAARTDASGALAARNARTDVAQHLLFGREFEVHAAPGIA